jgi:hypothetical protein
MSMLGFMQLMNPFFHFSIHSMPASGKFYGTRDGQQHFPIFSRH